jgi:purine catabolism regulator
MVGSFDVRAAIESLPYVEALVAGGAGGLARRVDGVRHAATSEQLHRAGVNELVVTTPTLVTSEEDPEQLVARLDAAQVAGIAVRLGPSDLLPREMLKVADRLSLPVITFDEEAALAEVTAAVLDALLQAQGLRLERVLDIHRRFSEIDLAGGGTTEIAEALHDVMGCPIAVVDNVGKVTVIIPAGAGRNLGCIATSTVRRLIRAGDHAYGEIVAVTDGATLDEDRSVALERAAMSIAVRLAQASAVAEAEERFAAISLEELIAGHAGTAADVAERAISFGWDLGRPRAVLLRQSTRRRRAPSFREPSPPSPRPPGPHSGVTRSSGRAAQRSLRCSLPTLMIRPNGDASPNVCASSSMTGCGPSP